jgi:CheY-like chemotaxis protein
MSVSVLVVEDQQDILARVIALLERAGYVAHGARNPGEALDLLKNLPRPCLLFWDTMTPRQSLSILDQATLDGVHVASLPVSVTCLRSSDSALPMKRLTSEDAILSILEEHCPLAETGTE